MGHGEEKIHLAVSSLFSCNGNSNLWFRAAYEWSLWREQYTLRGSDAISVAQIFPRCLSYFDCSTDIWIFWVWHDSWVRSLHFMYLTNIFQIIIIFTIMICPIWTISFSHLYGPTKNNDGIHVAQKKLKQKKATKAGVAMLMVGLESLQLPC